MSAVDTLSMFQAAKGPSRRLDDAVAEIVGWSRRFELVNDPDTGASKRVQKKVWLVPSGEEEKPVPEYSKNAQHAYEMLQSINKNVPCAVSVSSGIARAQIWGEEAQVAPNVAMAICMAALNHVVRSS
jgi:hypothetical protein